jgi:hypothetical protein
MVPMFSVHPTGQKSKEYPQVERLPVALSSATPRFGEAVTIAAEPREFDSQPGRRREHRKVGGV